MQKEQAPPSAAPQGGSASRRPLELLSVHIFCTMFYIFVVVFTQTALALEGFSYLVSNRIELDWRGFAMSAVAVGGGRTSNFATGALRAA